MKKLTAAIAAFVALSSSVALAETPTVRDMNSFDTVLKKSTAHTGGQAAKGSEFVIYHQETAKPAPRHEMTKHHGKKAKKAAKKHGKKLDDHKKHVKKANKPVARVKKDDAAESNSEAR